MFNFTTLTILNTVVQATDALVRAKTATKGYNIVTKTGTKGPEVRIGNARFNAADVLDIQVKNHTVENLAKVEFDIADVITLVTAGGADVQAGNYRIVLYLGLNMNSLDSFYANDFVYKGKPLFIEFPITATDDEDAVGERIVKIANKYMLFVAQERILNVSNNAGVVTFEGVNGYQVIKKAVLQKFDPNARTIDCCNNTGDFIDIVTGVPVTYTTDAAGVVTAGTQTLDMDGLRNLANNEVAIEPGLEAFGDYNWMIHNLRLPTLANTSFWAPTKLEMPVVGGQYTQFIVRLIKNRDGIGGEVVGQRATTVTTHVFYVLDLGTNVAQFRTLLTSLHALSTDADTELVDPYAHA